MRFNYFQMLCICLITLVSNYFTPASTQINIAGPQGTYKFGEQVLALPNGNIVVTDTFYTVPGPTQITQAGAVFLYNGRSGALISKLTGDHNYARIGSSVTALTNGNFVATGGVWSANYNDLMGAAIFCNGETGCDGTMTAANSLVGNKPDDYAAGLITPLKNGNYLVSSTYWDNGSMVDAGAITFCNGTTGCVGVISEANSLVGGNANDQVGGTCDPCPRGIVTLPNGNYIISNIRWNSNRGAVTLGNGATGTTGVVSSENSLIGANPGDMVGYSDPSRIGITILANNNYVVGSTEAINRRGAASLCDGVTGCRGTVSEANSLVGANIADGTGSQIVALTNGNYVVVSPEWDLSPSLYAVGAVTFCNGTTGRIETVSSANSLVGSNPNDHLGEFGIHPLTNGNYIVRSPSWNANRGAVTFANGTTGIIGTVSAQNSLVGTQRPANMPQDRIGERQFAVLTNGNYAVASEKWFYSRGAVTFINGNTGIAGEVSAANSLIGSALNDLVGASLIALVNGNYVVGSPGWDNGAAANAGAVTLCQGNTGCFGEITPSNSLYGNAGDYVGSSYQGLKALTNGNYVVASQNWNNTRGAVTFGNGTTGIVGLVSAENSLVGQLVNDKVGAEGIVALTNGNYVVNSSYWNNGSTTRVGAVSFGNGTVGTRGIVSAANSLIGNTTDDIVGFDSTSQGLGGGIYPLSNGGYIVRSRYFDNGSILNAGAISLGRANVPLTGMVSAENSVRGTSSQPSYPGLRFAYDYKNKQVVVGRPDSAIVSLFRYDETRAVFDFDGDGKTDIGVFRPSDGSWWYLRTLDNQFRVSSFGTSTDLITPADFTGDGKTDIAIFRPSSGFWFVQRSEDNSFFSFPFGASGDIPAPADYDGDGKTDAAVLRPSDGTWYIRRSSDLGTSIVQFGSSEDKPVPADYDGDGKSDIAIFRPSDGSWWYLRSSDAGFRVYRFGVGTDKPVQGDYTGDGKADIAVFRPSTGEWFVQRSEDNSFYSVPFGASGDVPAPGDYDGDGKFDPAVFRPSTAEWFVNRSTAGILITSFGAVSDVPISGAFVP